MAILFFTLFLRTVIRIYRNIDDIRDLKEILHSHFGCIRDVLAEHGIAGKDPFSFVHELFDNNTEYEGEEYGTINISLRFENRIKQAISLISTQVYLKTEDIHIRGLHPLEVIEARFRLYLEKRGVIPLRFTGQGDNKEEQLNRELAFRKEKGIIERLDGKVISTLKKELRELILELRRYINKKGSIDKETDIILKQVEKVIKVVQFSTIKQGYGNFVSYRNKENYEYFYQEDTSTWENRRHTGNLAANTNPWRQG